MVDKPKELIELQWTFAILISHLIDFAYREGYTVTTDEYYRPPETAALYAKQGRGSKNSLHPLKLAADLNVFKNGKLLANWKDYQFMGDYWKELSTPGIECCWGGDFTGAVPRDARHFSIGYQGRK